MKKTLLYSLFLLIVTIAILSAAATAFAKEPQEGPEPGLTPPPEEMGPGMMPPPERMEPGMGPQDDMQGDEAKKHMFRAAIFKKWLEKEMPDLVQKLEGVREENPEAAERFVHEMKERNKEHIFKGHGRGLDKETKEILEKYLSSELDSFVLAEKLQTSTDDKEKEKLTAELKKVLGTSFDLKEQIQAKVVEKIEQRVQKLKDMMEKRKALKDKIIDERIDQITSASPLTQW
jgi:hypothetical protein